MSKIKLAAQLYTIREFTQNTEDFESSMKKIADIGYKYVQISGVNNVDAKTIKRVCDNNNLIICATHVSQDMLNDIDKTVKYHNTLNCKYVGLGAMPEEYRKDKEGIIAFSNKTDIIAKKLKENDLQFIYHNHNFEFENTNEGTFLDILFDNTSDAFDFEIDTYWVQAGGANPVSWIKKAKDRMDVIHFKDMTVKGFESRFCEIGSGNLKWDEIVKACLETNVKYAAVEQDSFFDDPFKSLKSSYDYIMKNFGEVFE